MCQLKCRGDVRGLVSVSGSGLIIHGPKPPLGGTGRSELSFGYGTVDVCVAHVCQRETWCFQCSRSVWSAVLLGAASLERCV